MADDSRFSPGNPNRRNKKREEAIYGIFAESDSDSDSNEYNDEPHGRFKPFRGFNRGQGRRTHGSDSTPQLKETRFVKGGTLKPGDNNAMNQAEDIPRVDIVNASYEGQSDMEIMSQISESDLIDHILADDHLEYRNEKSKEMISDDDDEMMILRARNDLDKLDVRLRNTRRNDGCDEGVAYNPDVGLHPTEMVKMYGSGLKMMQKMGYKGGGLGRHGTGVVAPIEVKARQQQLGLQNDEEMSSKNRKLIQQINGEPTRSYGLKITYSNKWRQKGFSEYQIDGGSGIQNTMAPELDQLIEELSSKVLWYGEIARDNFMQMQKVEQSLSEIEHDIASLEVTVNSKEELLSQCENSAARIKEACTRFDDSLKALKESPNEKLCYTILDRLFNSFREELNYNAEVYSTLNVDEIASSYVRRCFDIIFADWHVNHEWSRGITLLRLCKEFFRDREGQRDMQFHVKCVIESSLISFFANIWDVAETDMGLRCYETWRSAILPFDKPGYTITKQLKETVVGRLLDCMSTGGRAHVAHIIVHPWLSIFGDEEMQRLTSTFTQMTKDLFSKEAINDIDRCKNVINAWKVLLDQHTLDTVTSYLCTCLMLALKEVDINPRNQDTRTVEAIVLWHDYIGAQRLADVFCKDFMPRWLTVLKNWLHLPSADLEEIIVWYGGWKSLYPKPMLSGTTIESFFKEALREMDRVSRDILNMPTSDSNRKNHLGGVNSLPTMLHKVENLGAAYGITIIKRHGLQCEGQQVYAFGSASVIFDGDSVMVVKKGIATPITLDELIKVAQ